MKKFVVCCLALLLLILMPVISKAAPAGDENDFVHLFESHGAVMLIIDSDTGSILYANAAATAFYGYSKEQLLSMDYSRINAMSPEDTAAEMQNAANEQRNYFELRHRLASGAIRDVEVFSYPVTYAGKAALFSIVHDITVKNSLLARENRWQTAIYLLGSAGIVLLLIALYFLSRSRRTIRQDKLEIEALNELRQTYIDADRNMVYLKDENLRYVFVNKALLAFYGKEAQQIIGHDDFELTEAAFAQRRRNTDLLVQQQNQLVTVDVPWQGRIYENTKFPVRLYSGRTGIGAYIRDVTDERAREKRVVQDELRYQILFEVFGRTFPNRKALLDFALNEALKLTNSAYGFIHIYDDEKAEFTLNSWTRGVMDDCEVETIPQVHMLDKAGIWAEVIHSRKPLILNEFRESNPLKKGFPKGHLQLDTFLSIPVTVDGRIITVACVANNPDGYTQNDADAFMLLMSGVWSAVQRLESAQQLVYERNKSLQTLMSIGDGVMVVDAMGLIERINRVAEELTGYSSDEARGRHYKDVFILEHETQGETIADPVEKVLESGKTYNLASSAVLVSRSGVRHALDDSAAPIQDEAGNTAGVVLVFRDVTDKQAYRKEVEYLSFHDALTGLYNRRFFEVEMKRLDTQRNLPISVIMGDVNGLKLTNDIFGHEYGDTLLKKAATALKNACRADDIISRWGGDEFVLLLPKTAEPDAEVVLARIRAEFEKEYVMTIRGSISLGLGVKTDITQNLQDVLGEAEEKMYTLKITDREKVRTEAIDTIVDTLHKHNEREREHSQRVSKLCSSFGKALGLEDKEIDKLKDAGYLHDIGKIVLEPSLLEKNPPLTTDDWNELKRHPVVGYRILNFFDTTLDLAESILSHQERWDGTGYPRGLRGEQIPLFARIISIAECYDVMVSGSARGGPMTPTDAIDEILRNAGTQFDPMLAGVFVRMVSSQAD